MERTTASGITRHSAGRRAVRRDIDPRQRGPRTGAGQALPAAPGQPERAQRGILDREGDGDQLWGQLIGVASRRSRSGPGSGPAFPAGWSRTRRVRPAGRV